MLTNQVQEQLTFLLVYIYSKLLLNFPLMLVVLPAVKFQIRIWFFLLQKFHHPIFLQNVVSIIVQHQLPKTMNVILDLLQN
jgi:hypothetical protein